MGRTRHGNTFIAVLIFLALTSLTAGGLYLWQTRPVPSSPTAPSPIIMSPENAFPASSVVPASPTSPTATIDATATWKAYRNWVISFYFPSNWNLEPRRVLGSRTTQEIKDTDGNYNFTFSTQANYNNGTGRPYRDLYEFIGIPYKVQEVKVAGQKAVQPLPRAGSENVFGVSFFSKDLTSIVSLELETPKDGSKIEEARETFNQILLTFRFPD